jgi:hypothetical protein
MSNVDYRGGEQKNYELTPHLPHFVDFTMAIWSSVRRVEEEFCRVLRRASLRSSVRGNILMTHR